MLNYLTVDKIIKDALKEDAPYGDITTLAIIRDSKMAKANIIAKEDGIICGIPIFSRVFEILGNVKFTSFINEGDSVIANTIIGEVEGDAHNILVGERLALNLLQRLSGIATITRKYCNELVGVKTKILDSRKTTPNLRYLEKYAVVVGGGQNHRFSLSDGVMLKDNHIAYAGGIKEAVNRVRENVSFVRKIEVETETKEQVLEALEAGVDIIMLDNMKPELVSEMVKLINGRALIECSGNITLSNIREYAEAGADYISSGALTHSIKAMDISLKNLSII